MLLYEIADDVHWLMLTDVKHIKKSVLCAQDSFVRSLMSPKQTADLSLYTCRLPVKSEFYIDHRIIPE